MRWRRTLLVLISFFVISACGDDAANRIAEPTLEQREILKRGDLTASLDDARACYGDTIEVALDTRFENDPVLSLPTDYYFTINPRSRDASGPPFVRDVWRKTCHPEPVPVSNIYRVFNNYSSPLMGLEDGLVLHRLVITGYGETFPSFLDDFPRGHGGERETPLPDTQHDEVLERAETGFLTNNRGYFLYDGDYRFPNNDKFALGCFASTNDGRECRVSYQVARKVIINYHFHDDEVPQDRWIELDQTVRDSVYDMIVDARPVLPFD